MFICLVDINYFQGSYGLVKLAYNAEDDTHYVSYLIIILGIGIWSFPIVQFVLSVGYENFIKEEVI